MYNAEFKKDYINEKSYRNMNLENYMNCQFEKVEKFEEKLDKDLCNFSVDEIINYYKSLCLTAYETVAVLNSQFKIYTDYCMSRNLVKDNQNHYAEIVHSIIFDCINYGLLYERIATREDILHMIEELQNPSDQFLVLALFEGICGKQMCDLIHLTKNDFVGDEIILSDGRRQKISEELKHYAMSSIEAYQYVTYSATGENKILNYLPTDHHVLKSLYNVFKDGDTEKSRRTYNKLVRVKKYLGAECITVSALNESGRIHTIRNLAKADGTDFKTAMLKHKEVEEIYGKVYSYTTYMLKYGDIIEGYEKL